MLFWAPALQQTKQGSYEITHRAPQLSATYRIILEGITTEGTPVHLEETFSTEAPYEFTTTFPPHAVVGDTMLLAAIVRNNTDQAVNFTEVFTTDTAFMAATERDLPTTFTIPANDQTTRYQRVVAVNQGKKATINWSVETPKKNLYQQAVVTIRSRLFTHQSSASSAGGRELEVRFTPKRYVGEVTAELQLYGTSLEQITRSFAGMLREPHGCFEQVTSTAYPNALIVGLLQADTLQQYQKEIRRARHYLASGYQQLSRYEQAGGGFGLWENRPAKPRYSAMALLQFADLANVWDGVKPAMITRTRRYLANAIKKAGFVEGPAQLYQLLALAQHRENGLDSLIEQHASAVAQQPDEHYYALLLTQVYLAQGRLEEARTQVQRLVPVVQSQTLNARSRSAGIGSAYGRFSQVEMLGHFIESYLATEGYDGTVEAAFSWATELKSKHYYLPTQAKVRYLRALAALAGYRKLPDAGYLEVFVNGSKTDTIHYAVGRNRTLKLRLTPHLQAGENRVRLRFAERDVYPALRWEAKWQQVLPPKAESSPIVVVPRADTVANVGDIISYRLELTNTTDASVKAPMLQVGLPGNVSLLAKDLDPLVDQGTIDYYELDGQYLNLYFEEFAAKERRTIPLDLTARVAGTFHAPALVCYPYYQPHLRQFSRLPQLHVTE
ncbi:MAG: alpha-2-macroglobulin family protein [Bacteroidota bacterium]